MSKPFNTNVDLLKNELQNARLQNLGTGPASPVVGQMYYDTGTLQPKWWSGTAWTNLATDTALLNGQNAAYYLNRANHTGQQLSSTISDLASTVQAYKLNQFAAPVANVAFGGYNVSGAAAAASAGQFVEYAQWQAAIGAQASGLDFKSPPAIVVTTTNVNLAAPGATLSGHTMVTGDSFLAVGQTTTTQNGLYNWNGSGTAATRRADSNSAGSITSGTLVSISNQDSTNPDTVWMQTATGTGANGAIVLGTDAQNWLKPFSATAYTFGNGLQNVSGTVSVLPDPVAGGGIVVTAAGVKVDTAVVTRKYAQTFGDGSTVSFNITHNLGTVDVMVQVYIVATGQSIEVDVVRTSTTVVQLNMVNPPGNNAYRVVVQG